MKIRHLKRTSGEAVLHPWPPSWGGWYRAGDAWPRGEVGVLKSVKNNGYHLILRIEHEGREWGGSLQWDAPPTVAALEKVLRAHSGQTIKAIGEVEVKIEVADKHRSGAAHGRRRHLLQDGPGAN